MFSIMTEVKGHGWFEVLATNVGRLALLIRPGKWEGAQNLPETISDNFC